MYVWETEGGFEGSIEYDGHLFDASTIACLAGAYGRWRRGWRGIRISPIDELPLVSEEQEAEWFGPSQGTQMAVPRRAFDQWIERQAKKSPECSGGGLRRRRR